MKYIFIFMMFIAMSIGATETQPMRYYGVPLFYSNLMPKQIECDFDKESRQGGCGYQEGAVRGMVGYTLTDRVDLKGTGKEVLLFVEVVCINGDCKSNYGQPMGTIKLPGVTYWSIPQGYYLSNIGIGLTAFKHGNGPLAKQYPIRDVLIVPKFGEPDGYYIPEDKTRLTFNVYCNVGNECSYLGRVIKYNQLNKYVPKRLSHNCDIQFCYDDETNVIGLNPRG